MSAADVRIAVLVFTSFVALALVAVLIYDRIDRRKTHKWVEKRLGGK